MLRPYLTPLGSLNAGHQIFILHAGELKIFPCRICQATKKVVSFLKLTTPMSFPKEMMVLLIKQKVQNQNHSPTLSKLSIIFIETQRYQNT